MLHNGLDETNWSSQTSVPPSLSLLLGNCLNAINKTSTGKRYPLRFALSYLLQHTLHSEYILFFKFLIQPTRNAHGDATRSKATYFECITGMFCSFTSLSSACLSCWPIPTVNFSEKVIQGHGVMS